MFRLATQQTKAPRCWIRGTIVLYLFGDTNKLNLAKATRQRRIIITRKLNIFSRTLQMNKTRRPSRRKTMWNLLFDGAKAWKYLARLHLAPNRMLVCDPHLSAWWKIVGEMAMSSSWLMAIISVAWKRACWANCECLPSTNVHWRIHFLLYRRMRIQKFLLHKSRMEFNDDVCPTRWDRRNTMWEDAQGSVLDRLINLQC